MTLNSPILINRIAEWILAANDPAMPHREEHIDITSMAEWDRMAQGIIDCAKRTPYFHLEGYMDRYWLLPEIFGLHARVHRILRSDLDRHLHDHPWPYVSIILQGGYTEITPHREPAIYGPGSVLYRRAESLHRLIVQDGGTCTSLFIMGQREQEWGFATETGKVNWKDYLPPEHVAEQQEKHAEFGIIG